MKKHRYQRVQLGLLAALASSFIFKPLYAADTGSPHGCGLKLTQLAALANHVLPTSKTAQNIEWANFYKNWRGAENDPPRYLKAASNVAAKLNELLHNEGGLESAIFLAKRYIDGIEYTYRIIHDVIKPIREKLTSLKTSLSENTNSKLSPEELRILNETFLDVSKKFIGIEKYSKKDQAALKAIIDLESKLKASPQESLLTRSETISLLSDLEAWMGVKEELRAAKMAQDRPVYVTLMNFLDTDYKDLNTSFSQGADSAADFGTAGMGAMNESPGAALEAQKIEVPSNKSEAQADWESNKARLIERVGWNKDAQKLNEDLSNERPTRDQINDYLNSSRAASEAHTRMMRSKERNWTLLNQALHLIPGTPVVLFTRNVILPLLTRAWSPKGWVQMLVSIRETFLSPFFRLDLLNEIQRISSSTDTIERKAEVVANAYSKSLTGDYFLDLFPSYYTADSRKAWNEIKAYVDSPDSLYPMLRKPMAAADERANLRKPLSLEASGLSYAQVVGYSVQSIIFVILYCNYQNDDDRKEIDDAFGIVHEALGGQSQIPPPPPIPTPLPVAQ